MVKELSTSHRAAVSPVLDAGDQAALGIVVKYPITVLSPVNLSALAQGVVFGGGYKRGALCGINGDFLNPLPIIPSAADPKRGLAVLFKEEAGELGGIGGVLIRNM